MNKTCFILFFFFTFSFFAETKASDRCQEFKRFSTKNKKFQTDGLVIEKNGEILFEWYDRFHGPDVPHALWSVSKSITGALLGRAVDDGNIDLDARVFDFYPYNPSPQYKKIKIANLFYLDSGFVWDEYYSGHVNKSPVLNMLYGKGHQNMALFSATRPVIKNGPGYLWSYTTGTPVITMGILKKVYEESYDEMPWRNLFTPLGMKGVVFERDHKGVFNGGSSVFATPKDMAKFGQLLLNRGMWQGKEILSDDWIKKTMQISPGYLSEGTIIRDITDDGVYGGSIWLNLSLRGHGRPYPFSPKDMFLAMGHFGQLIIVLPSQKMVIARTGHDEEYNSQIDEFVSRAISCFDDPLYPIGHEIPPPTYNKTSFYKIFQTLRSGLASNILQGSTAKSLCSCYYITRLSQEICLERSHIPGVQLLTKSYITKNKVYTELSMAGKALARILGVRSDGSAWASYQADRPQFGCMLE